MLSACHIMGIVPAFDALLLDFDGVLRLWDRERPAGLERRYEVPPGTLARAFRRELVIPPCMGQCSHQEWMDRFTREISPLSERASDLICEWHAHRGAVDPAMLALVREIRKAVPVVLVSNATDWLDRDLAKLGLVREVDGVVNSSVVGVIKPDPAIYHHAAAVAGCPAARCVFVDDEPENVEGAAAVGMRAIRFVGHSALRHELASILM